MPNILVDTSCWVEVLRVDGNQAVQKSVGDILVEDQVVWCDMVVLELWNGARGQKERAALHDFQAVLMCLQIDVTVWQAAKNLALVCRMKGLTIPPTDLLIATCAIENKIPLWHRDKHFTKIPGLIQKFV